MKRAINCITIIAIATIVACNDSGTATTEDVPVTPTDSSASADSTNKMADNDSFAEINDYSNLPKDLMRITYRGLVDTLHGNRRGDTLYFGGDIKMIYPVTGVRGVGSTNSLWKKFSTGRVVVPYQIRNDYPHKDWVLAAIKMWQDKLPNFRFQPQSAETDFILFVPSENTQSNIGRIGGVQTIELSSDAVTGNIAHEIGHALGLYHEQSRKDRDNFVTVLCPNDFNYKHAFKGDPYAIDIGPYNYNSIMQYPPSGCLQMPANLPENANPGQRLRITQGDVEAVLKIYRIN